MLFESIDDVLSSLSGVGYHTDHRTASSVYLSDFLQRPILLEGPAGAGKTELAMALSRCRKLPVIRLQCYEGITMEDVIGHYDRSLQDLYIKITNHGEAATNPAEWERFKQHLQSREFYRAGPLLQSIERDSPCVLLIDEVDKVGYAFEAMLLEFLSVWELSIPGMGTVKARNIPTTIISSNAERYLGNALRRRSVYILVEHPSAEREAAIVATKTPNLDPSIHRYIAALAIVLRKRKFEKPPSISEMLDIARSMEKLGLTTIEPEDRDTFLPIFCKTKKDVDQMLGLRDVFASILSEAKRELSLINSNVVYPLREAESDNDV